MVVGLITNNDEKVYVEGVEKLSHWSVANNLFLNISKRKNWWWTLEGLTSEWRTYTALTINSTPVKSEQLQVPQCTHLQGAVKNSKEVQHLLS